MNKVDFYKMALLAGAYTRKDWVISAFAVIRSAAAEGGPSPKPFDIRYNRESTEGYVPDGSGGYDWAPITGTEPMHALYTAGHALRVEVADIPNATEAVDSTYGDLLFNWIALVHPFNDRIKYQVGPIKIRKIEEMIAERLCDNEEVAGVKPRPDQIPVWMYMDFGRCMGALAGYTQLFVPTLGPKSLKVDPKIIATRDRLLKENEDRLHDPVVISRIQNELIAMDRENMKGDPSEGFLLSNKTYGTARKRMFYIHGPEAGFAEGGNAELVVNSLNEGWDTTKLPAMFNSTRAGSFYRGALTALGGEAVKFFMRVFQNTRITVDDCGAQLGRLRWIDPRQPNYYVGLWEINKDLSLTALTKERIEEMKGKYILTRTPSFCKVEGSNFCAKCCGVRLAENPNGLGAENTSVASKFMDIMMASAHAKELKTARLDFRAAFT